MTINSGRAKTEKGIRKSKMGAHKPIEYVYRVVKLSSRRQISRLRAILAIPFSWHVCEDKGNIDYSSVTKYTCICSPTFFSYSNRIATLGAFYNQSTFIPPLPIKQHSHCSLFDLDHCSSSSKKDQVRHCRPMYKHHHPRLGKCRRLCGPKGDRWGERDDD